jgi:AraC family transcriptional regulator
MSVRGYHYLGSDVEVPSLRDFVVVAFRRGHTDLSRKIDGRWTEEDDVGPGDVSLLTRASRVCRRSSAAGCGDGRSAATRGV